MTRWILGLCAALALGAQAQGGEPAPLVVGVDTSSHPPWEIVQDEQISGLDVDIINRIAAKLGLKVVYHSCPFVRCLADLENGTIDLMGFLAFKEERSAFLRYIQPGYINGTKAFFVRKGDAKRIQKYEDLQGLTIGLIRASKHFAPFDSDPQIRRYESSTLAKLMNMLVLKRIDAVVDNDSSGLYFLHQLGLEDQVEMADFRVAFKGNGYFAFSRKSRYLDKAPEYEKLLQELLRSGGLPP